MLHQGLGKIIWFIPQPVNYRFYLSPGMGPNLFGIIDSPGYGGGRDPRGLGDIFDPDILPPYKGASR
jgi:hypothetical protein